METKKQYSKYTFETNKKESTMIVGKNYLLSLFGLTFGGINIYCYFTFLNYCSGSKEYLMSKISGKKLFPQMVATAREYVLKHDPAILEKLENNAEEYCVLPIIPDS